MLSDIDMFDSGISGHSNDLYHTLLNTKISWWLSESDHHERDQDDDDDDHNHYQRHHHCLVSSNPISRSCGYNHPNPLCQQSTSCHCHHLHQHLHQLQPS